MTWKPEEEMGPQRMYGLTLWVRRLLVANLLVFLIQKTLLVAPRYLDAFGFDPMQAWQQPWTFVTYMFLHSPDSIFHILFNMLALWMFGCTLERRWGSEFFLKYFFVSVIGGGIFNAVFLPGQMVPSIGASGGIYGILLAFGLIYPNQTVLFFFLFPMKMKYFVMIIGAIALHSSLVSAHSGVAHLAHLGGMVVGYVYLRWGNPWEQWKLYRDRRRLARLRRRFQVVQGRKDDDSDVTYH